MFAIDKMNAKQLESLFHCLPEKNKSAIQNTIENLRLEHLRVKDYSWKNLEKGTYVIIPDPYDFYRSWPINVVKEELVKTLSEMNLLGVLDQIILDASTMGDNFSWDNARAKLMERGYRMRLLPHLDKVKSL